ncbi:xanthine/uracil permease [Tetragenococcus halophilus subsp. flandriensis]|uniref:uracil-xanthine permease family protein n=1 Tax=Tetragenococcus halophilus TaxID=51669 RepID=UPI0023E96F18|nr:solute carrier family 23 protein [Tetragenococcus halophilus]GMA09301.1 xanthine/uracil permease [Tetragenococcus halophilus subsp. flandriensis]
MKNDQIPEVDEKLPVKKNLLLGFQHTIIAVLAAIPVPLLIAANSGLSSEETSFFINAVIFGAGLSTLLAALNIIPKTSPMIPMVMGANFSVVPIASTTLNDASSTEVGFQIIAGSTMIVGIFCFLAAPFWIKLQRFFPPLVVGTNLIVLGVSLLPNTFHWLMGAKAHNLTESMDLTPLLMALTIFVFHLIISKYFKGLLGNLTILIALVFGTLLAIFLGMMDFTPVGQEAWFGLNIPFHYGLPKFDLTATISFLIAMILGMVEISGTAMGIHDIVEKEMTKNQFSRVLKTLGIGTFISGLFNGVQPTAFVQNVGILDLSKIKSRFAIVTSGLMLLLIGFIPKFSALISAIPDPVLGGLGFAIFGIIIGSGINILKQVSFEGNQNMLIIGLSVGICMLPSVYPNFYANFPDIIQNILGSGILAGSLTAITLNLFFNFKELRNGAN